MLNVNNSSGFISTQKYAFFMFESGQFEASQNFKWFAKISIDWGSVICRPEWFVSGIQNHETHKMRRVFLKTNLFDIL